MITVARGLTHSALQARFLPRSLRIRSAYSRHSPLRLFSLLFLITALPLIPLSRAHAQAFDKAPYSEALHELGRELRRQTSTSASLLKNLYKKHFPEEMRELLSVELSKALTTVEQFGSEVFFLSPQRLGEIQAPSTSDDSILRMLKSQASTTKRIKASVLSNLKQLPQRIEPQRTLGKYSELREYRLRSGAAFYERF